MKICLRLHFCQKRLQESLLIKKNKGLYTHLRREEDRNERPNSKNIAYFYNF